MYLFWFVVISKKGDLHYRRLNFKLLGVPMVLDPPRVLGPHNIANIDI